MDNKVNNPEVNVSKTIDMNEKDYLQVILENEKNMSNNLMKQVMIYYLINFTTSLMM